MKFKPLHDRVIVKRLDEQEMSAGGLFIPDMAREKPQQGEVLAVGTGTILPSGEIVPLQVKVGDRVLFGKYAGTEVKFLDEEHLVMREDDILAIFE